MTAEDGKRWFQPEFRHARKSQGASMSFAGHIEQGMVVFDEAVSLPEGSRVRVEPVASPAQSPESNRPLIPDTDQPRTVTQIAQAWKNIARDIPIDGAALPVDPDNYPLF
jgi:hypothetical protein